MQKWCISYDNFVYKPSARDENSDYLHVYSFKHNCMHYVKDFSPDNTCKDTV